MAIGFMIIGPGLSAQTLFLRSDTTPNYENYRYWEECSSAMLRLSADVDRKERAWIGDDNDTILFDRSRYNQSRPAAAVAAGKQCLANLNVDTVRRDVAVQVAKMLLMANRDADADRLWRRLLDSGAAKERSAWLWEGIMMYFDARPKRVDAAKVLYNRWFTEEASHDSLPQRAHRILNMGELALTVGDAAYAHELGWRGIRTYDSIPLPERTKDAEAKRLAFVAMGVLQWLTEKEGLDSLAHSTSSFRAYFASTIVSRVYGDSLGIVRNPVGTTMPEIEGDFIYRYDQGQPRATTDETLAHFVKLAADTPTRRPVPGKVNLTVFLRGGCHDETREIGRGPLGRYPGGRMCRNTIAGLRRLKERFPQIEITIVGNTYGSFGNGSPLAPADEADSLAKFFLGFHRIPSTLLISTTSFFRIPGVDNRRIDERTITEEKFIERFGKRAVGSGKVYAIDETGLLFYADGIALWGEDVITKRIEAVFRRSQR